MALNCNTCGNKQNAVSQGHCTEFSHIPEIDACAMHTDSVSASKAKSTPVVSPTLPSEKGVYIWLNETHSSDQVVPLIK